MPKIVPKVKNCTKSSRKVPEVPKSVLKVEKVWKNLTNFKKL